VRYAAVASWSAHFLPEAAACNALQDLFLGRFRPAAFGNGPVARCTAPPRTACARCVSPAGRTRSRSSRSVSPKKTRTWRWRCCRFDCRTHRTPPPLP
jgi:hypothetical protein